MSASKYLAERGFSEAMIERVGWRVEPLNGDARLYGLPPDASGVLALRIPYGKFERIRLIDDADLERYGGGKYRQPKGQPLELYDPFGHLEGPGDCVLLIEGEANAVAIAELLPSLPAVGLPGQNGLKPELAARFASVPVVFVWIDEYDGGAERNLATIVERLYAAGVDEVRPLRGTAGIDANEVLQHYGRGRGRELVQELVDKAQPAEGSGQASTQAATELAELLKLPSVGLGITGARIVGRGSGASVDLRLTDGTEITLAALRDMANPSRLVEEVVACTGAEPMLKKPQAIRAVALVRKIAEHQQTLTIDDISREWGSSYLQAATTLDVNIDDQIERWGAFCQLHETDPVSRARVEGISVAAASIVLRHVDGTRLVRCGWFQAHARAMTAAVSPEQIAQRMQRVGWERRGKDGRIKATSPSTGDHRLWTFHLVPAGWETDS